MTDRERLAKFQELKELLNGPEADNFKGYWDGRFFTGDMTFIFDKTPYNMFFYEGTVIDVKMAQPANGYYVGIQGTQEQWDRFFAFPNFQVSISIKHNDKPFVQLGSAVACRQNQSMVAQVMRLIARVMTEEGK